MSLPGSRADARFGPEALAVVDGQRFSCVVLMVHPGSEEADEQRCNAVLRQLGPGGRVLVATPDPNRLGRLDLGGRRMQGPFGISNRHIPEKWRKYALFLSS
jgi:hypothetical protein